MRTSVRKTEGSTGSLRHNTLHNRTWKTPTFPRFRLVPDLITTAIHYPLMTGPFPLKLVWSKRVFQKFKIWPSLRIHPLRTSHSHFHDSAGNREKLKLNFANFSGRRWFQIRCESHCNSVSVVGKNRLWKFQAAPKLEICMRGWKPLWWARLDTATIYGTLDARYIPRSTHYTRWAWIVQHLQHMDILEQLHSELTTRDFH